MHLMIVDALNLIRRIDAVQAKHNSDESTLKLARQQALDGAMQKLRARLNPSHALAVFDAPSANSWRYSLFEAYKAKRKPMPQSLKLAIVELREHWEQQGLCCYINANDEADDLIATIAHKASCKQVNVTIVSTDLGFHQVVGPRIHLYDYFKQSYLDPMAYFEKLNITSDQLLDYLAMVGSSSANIAGVAGIGPKSAVEILRAYGSVTNAMAQSNDDNVHLKRLIEQKEAFLLAKQLLSYHLEIDLGLSLNQMRCYTNLT